MQFLTLRADMHNFGVRVRNVIPHQTVPQRHNNQ